MSIIEDIQRRSAHIHWPQGIVPEQADLFAHNDIVIAAPPGRIWEHLIHATAWPDWYSNASDVTVNTSSRLLGAIGAEAATSAWTSQAVHLPGAARRAAIGQARNVASARISSVTTALGPGHRAAAEQAFSHGYHVAVLIAGLGLIAAAIIAAFGLRDNRRRELDAAAGKPAPPGEPDNPTIVTQPQHTFAAQPDGGLNHVNH